MGAGVSLGCRIIMDELWKEGGIPPPPEPDSREFTDSEGVFLSEAKIAGWKDAYREQVTLWLDRLWVILRAPQERRRSRIQEWLAKIQSTSRDYSLEEVTKRLTQLRDRYVDVDWALIFSDVENPIEAIKSWPETLEDKHYKQLSVWLTLLERRALSYLQRIKTVDVDKCLKDYLSLELPSKCSEMFASSEAVAAHTACLVNCVFLRTLGRGVLTQSPCTAILHLDLNEPLNLDSFLVLVLREPKEAAALIMALDGKEQWTSLMRSQGFSEWVKSAFQSGKINACFLKEISDFIVQIGQQRSTDATTIFRKSQILHWFVSVIVKARAVVPVDVTSFSFLTTLIEQVKRSEELSLELLAVISLYVNTYESADLCRSLKRDLNELAKSRADFSWNTFLNNLVVLFRYRKLPPIRQIELLRSLLDSTPIRDFIEPENVFNEDPLALVLLVVYSARWGELEDVFEQRFLDKWLKAAAVTTQKEFARSFLNIFDVLDEEHFSEFWVYLRPIGEDADERFNIQHLMTQMPFHLSEPDESQLGTCAPFIQQLPPIIVYVGARSARSFLWMMRALPIFTLSQASAFFAAIPNGESPQLTQVIENFFGSLGGFNVVHRSGFVDDNFIIPLSSMSMGQQRLVFEAFKGYWEGELSRVHRELLQVNGRISSASGDEKLELSLKFAGSKGACGVLLQVAHPLLRLYREFNPPQYVELAERFQVILRSDIVALIEEQCTEVEDDGTGLLEFLTCFTPHIIETLAERVRNPSGGAMEHLPSYGIAGDADLVRIVGPKDEQLVLGESFVQFQLFAERRMAIWLSKHEPDVVDPEKRAQSCVRDWVANFDDSDRMLSRLLEEMNGFEVQDLIRRVLVPLGDKIREQELRPALLEYIEYWKEHNFLAKLSLYLDQPGNLETVWKELPWTRITEVPDFILLTELEEYAGLV